MARSFNFPRCATIAAAADGDMAWWCGAVRCSTVQRRVKSSPSRSRTYWVVACDAFFFYQAQSVASRAGSSSFDPGGSGSGERNAGPRASHQGEFIQLRDGFGSVRWLSERRLADLKVSLPFFHVWCFSEEALAQMKEGTR
ncbi:hypothetical protein K449DRAFT_386853 [Hypoxylon sp. EC38]|nr:hypothetical protein K449DRAFT_386853 [Hypoxylon sp. EC38]